MDPDEDMAYTSQMGSLPFTMPVEESMEELGVTRGIREGANISENTNEEKPNCSGYNLRKRKAKTDYLKMSGKKTVLIPSKKMTSFAPFVESPASTMNEIILRGYSGSNRSDIGFSNGQYETRRRFICLICNFNAADEGTLLEHHDKVHEPKPELN